MRSLTPLNQIVNICPAIPVRAASVNFTSCFLVFIANIAGNGPGAYNGDMKTVLKSEANHACRAALSGIQSFFIALYCPCIILKNTMKWYMITLNYNWRWLL